MKGLNERQLEALQQEPITKQAMKETGLTFDEMMAVQLTVPDEDVFTRACWSIGWTGKLDPYHIAPLQKFAILRWYYSAEAGAPGNEQQRQAASMFVHTATLGTYADDGNAVQQGRPKGGSANKRSEWAEDLADYLAGLDLTFPKAWATIPEDVNNWLELDEDTGVYRSDGGNIVVAFDLYNGGEKGRPQSLSNFRDRYFYPAKKKS